MITIKIDSPRDLFEALGENAEIVISLSDSRNSIHIDTYTTANPSFAATRPTPTDARAASASHSQYTSLPPDNLSFLTLFREQISRLEQNGSQRTSETYRGAYSRFRRFLYEADLSHGDLSADDLTPELVEDFQSHLRADGLSMNTISFYLRILRAVYNRAVNQGLTTNRHPFHHVYTGQARTVKRAVSQQTLHQLKHLPLDQASHRFARDMFLLSFYLRGMSFVDMAYLRHSDLNDGVLCYRRRKTGQMLMLKWEHQMQEIVERWPGCCGDYLLPVIRRANGKERNQYRYAQYNVNRGLKQLSKNLQLGTPLTMYCARHSWATIARDLQLPTDIISSAMGHTNLKTTEIYLKSIDISVIDQANRRIIEAI